MAEIGLAVVALGPPLLQFARNAAQLVKDIIKVNGFIENDENLKRLQLEICSLKSCMSIIKKSHISHDSGTKKLFSVCRDTLSTYVSKLDQIRLQIKKYRLSADDRAIVRANVLHLLEELKELDLDIQVTKWLAAVGAYTDLDTNNRVRQMQKVARSHQASCDNQQTRLDLIDHRVEELSKLARALTTSDQKKSNDHRASLNRIENLMYELLQAGRAHPTQGDHLLNMKVALKGLSQGCDELPGTAVLAKSGCVGSSSSGMPRIDTVDTTLNDKISTSSQRSHKMRRLQESAGKRGQRLKVTINQTPTKSWVPKTSHKEQAVKEIKQEEDSCQSHSVFAKDIYLDESGCPLVAGSIEKGEVSEAPVLKILQQDWNDGRHFDFDTAAPGLQTIITLHIALPLQFSDMNENPSKVLTPRQDDGSAFRTFSLVLLPVSTAKNRVRNIRSQIFSMSSDRLEAASLALHLDLKEATSKEDLQRQIGMSDSLRQVDRRLKAGSTNVAVYITIPWIGYQQWSQGTVENPCLDDLYSEGVLATLPIHLKMRDGSLKPRIWCEKEILHRTWDTAESSKTVHGIIQEYDYSGPKPSGSVTQALHYPIKFITIIYRIGDAQDWLELTRAVYTPELVQAEN